MELLLKIVGLLLLPPDSMLRTKLFWKRFVTAAATISISCILFAHCGQLSVPEQDASCTDASCSMAVEVPPAPLETIVARDNWEFILSGSGWNKMAVSGDNKSLQDAYIMGDREAIVLLLKIELDGGTLPQLVVSTVKEMVMGQAHLDSLEQETINQVKFIKITTHIHNDTENVTIFTWVGVKDNFGYIMHCAGKNVSDAGRPAIFDLCESIGNTIQIN
jgi:hypothetical protein